MNSIINAQKSIDNSTTPVTLAFSDDFNGNSGSFGPGEFAIVAFDGPKYGFEVTVKQGDVEVVSFQRQGFGSFRFQVPEGVHLSSFNVEILIFQTGARFTLFFPNATAA
jgi:hypothetical protein